MLVSMEQLRTCTAAILRGCGETPEQAACAAELMTQCDARGISTHGSHMLNLIYARREKGQLSFPTFIETIRNEGASAVLDGHDGLGQIGALKAVDLAIEKAKTYGIGAVMLRNTNNVGALGSYVERAAKEKQVCLFFCNASPAMAPWGGMEQFFGTQPFAIGIYLGENSYFVADMATSQVARGKIRKAARDGTPIPDNWALDREGNPTTDPAEAIRGVLLPIGGAKGSAIAMAIDMVAGLLSGAKYAPDVRAIHYPEGEAGIGCTVISMDIAHFMDPEEYEIKMADYVKRIKTMKKAGGFDEILLPGEAKQRRELLSLRNGVEIPDEEVDGINRALQLLGSPLRLQTL
ncbi:MAG: Ldh family oxidoreductase [Kiritimatiellae bacterium]|nr:Ldh family oxidoreductase [Kiritimatiellia bacterium]